MGIKLGIGKLSIGASRGGTALPSMAAPTVELASISQVVEQGDKYLAFPSMTVLPNGNWFLLYSENTIHSGTINGRTRAKISTDQGITWGDSYDLFTPKYITSRYDSYVSVIGSRVFLFINEYTAAAGLFCTLRYSDDSSQTWSASISITSAVINAAISHGHVVQTPSGDLLMPMWGQRTGDDYKTVEIMKSTDNGLTWADVAWVDNPLSATYVNDSLTGTGPGWLSEPALCYAPNGNLLLYTRGNGLLWTSYDDGGTWGDELQLGHDFGSPQLFVDGTDLYIMGRYRFNQTVAWSYQNVTDYTLRYRKSTDNGLTWGDAIIVDNYGSIMEGDGAYASAIVHDGKISVMFYTNDGYDNLLGVASEYQPYLRFIDDIKYNSHFGDPDYTNVKITVPTATSITAQKKIGSGAWTTIKTVSGSELNYQELKNQLVSYSCLATIGGTVYQTEVQNRYVYDARATKLINNMDAVNELPDESLQDSLNTLITGLKASNLFETKLDSLVLSFMHEKKSMRMNIVRDGSHLIPYDNGGTLGYNPFEGLHSDGTNSYVRAFVDGRGINYRYRLLPADNSSWGVKINGVIATTGKHGHGLGLPVPNRYNGFSTDEANGSVGLNSGALNAATKRDIGYNLVTRNGAFYTDHYINDSYELVSANNSQDLTSGLLHYLLATSTTASAPTDFTASTELIEVFWAGGYMTSTEYNTFKELINTFAASRYPYAVLTGKNTITITENAALNEASTISADDFSIAYEDGAIAVTNAVISGSTMVLTIDRIPQLLNYLDITYTPGLVEYDAGGLIAGFTKRVSVTHLLSDAPELLSAEIGLVGTDEYTWTLKFGASIADVTMPDVSAFVSAGFTWSAIVRTDATTITLTANEAATPSSITNHQTYPLAYTKPATNPLTGTNDNYVNTFTTTVKARNTTDDTHTLVWGDLDEINTLTKTPTTVNGVVIDQLTTIKDRLLSGRDLACGATHVEYDPFEEAAFFNGYAAYAKTAAFTLNRPETIYLLVKQDSWTDTKPIMDGNASNSGRVFQDTTFPGISGNAGTVGGRNTDLPVNRWAILRVTFKGAGSIIRINKGTATTWNSGAANMGGFTLGALGGHITGFYCHMHIAEAIVRDDDIAVDSVLDLAIINNLIAKHPKKLGYLI